jgi:hypothetical protein
MAKRTRTKAPATAAAKAPTEPLRIASRGKREPYLTLWQGRLPQPDELLNRYSKGRDGMNRTGLLTRVMQQFPNIAGWCGEWCESVLEIERVIQAAKASTPEDQAIADAAALRMKNAWERMGTSYIALTNILMGRFYGFARCEIVPTFDTTLGEWIPWLYDVPQEAWLFGDDGRAFLVTMLNFVGLEVDPSRFLKFTWGSVDTDYGAGVLSKGYVPSWKIQALENLLMQAIEDNNAPCTAVGIPRSIQKQNEIDDIKAQARDSWGNVIFYPTDSTQLEIKREAAVAASGQTGKAETSGIELYERWIQTLIFGAPQTGNRSLGTGKVEDVRQSVWSHGTTAASNMLDLCLTEQWGARYCDWNLSDVPPALRPSFKSTSINIAAGLSGPAAQNARDIALNLAREEITATVAVELWTALGISPARARAMADSTIAERKSLRAPDPRTTPSATSTPDPATAPNAGPDDQEAAA